MNNVPYLLSLNNTSPTAARAGGGKFAGLVRAKPLIEKYVAEYNVPLAIPETYAIAINTPQDKIMDTAMRAMDACGGNVAVRSSADIEDASGKTYSGAFESVLNVSDKNQMRDALNTVYQSAARVAGAKMGIVIQRMITNPTISGVVYSADFNGDPMTVINYTHGRPADLLLANREKGNLTKISKYIRDDNNNMRLFKFSDFSNNDKYDCLYHLSQYDMLAQMPLRLITEYKLNNIYNLVALGNHLESDFGHPVDIEFAIAPNGTTYILQQRPYIINPDYVVNKLKNNDIVGYKKQSPIIRGTVKIIDRKYATKDARDNALANGEFADKILLSKIYDWDTFVILAWVDSDENILKSKLKIDASYQLHSEIYGHCGNQFRERGTPFLSTRRTADFANVNDGDVMEIDMRTAQFKIISKNKTH